jgi:hypothetical protein
MVSPDCNRLFNFFVENMLYLFLLSLIDFYSLISLFLFFGANNDPDNKKNNNIFSL